MSDEEADIFELLVSDNRDRLEREFKEPTKKSNFLLTATDSLGRTPLYWACQRGDVKLFDLFISQGSKFETPDNDRWTPLFVAALNGHTTIVNRLLNLNANTETQEDKFGWTPLFAAVWNGHLSVVRDLARYKPNLEAKDKKGRTCFFIACLRNYYPMVELLLEQGADVNAVDEYCRSPLYISVQLGYKYIVKRLLDLDNCDKDLPDKDKRTPLFLSTHLGYQEITTLLVEKGADSNLLLATGLEPTEEITEEIDSKYPCKGLFMTAKQINPPIKIMSMVVKDDQIWAGGSNGSILVWEKETNTLLCYNQDALKETVLDMLVVEDTVWALSPNKGIYIWRWNAASKSKSIYDPKDRLVSAFVIQPTHDTIMCMMKKDHHVYGGTFLNSIYVWNSKVYTGEKKTFDISKSPFEIKPHDNWVSCMLAYKGLVYFAIRKLIFIYDPKNNFQVVGYLECPSDVANMCAKHGRLWACSRDSSIRIFDLKTKQCLKSHDSIKAQKIISVGKTQILTGGYDHVIKSFDSQTLEYKRTWKERHSDEITCMLWTGSELWVGSLDKSVTIWH